jgi:hypothetical protein
MKQFLTIVGVYFVLAMAVVYVAQQAGAERGLAGRSTDAGKNSLANRSF